MKQYVLPIIFYNYYEKCGMMVVDIFATAGHVISKCPPKIRWNDKRIPLITTIVFKNVENDYDSHDVALYSIQNINSQLVLIFSSLCKFIEDSCAF